MSPRRFDGGVTNAGATTLMNAYGAPDPTKYHTFFDDFDVLNPTDGETWDIAATSGSVALSDADGGCVVLTTNAADNALAQIATVGENFTLAAGKKAWFKASITAMAGATSQDIIIGLHSDDQTPVAGAPADGVYFRKDDGDTDWDFQIMNTSVSVGLDTAIATATTGAITLGFAFDGVSKFDVYVNDILTTTVTTADFPTAAMGVAATVQAGSSSAATLTVDYLFCTKER